MSKKKQGKSIPWLLKDNGADMKMIAEFDNYTQFNPFFGEVYKIPAGEYDPKILDFDGNIYYHGYWLNKGWFKKFKQQFRMEFRFPAITDEYNKVLMHRILNEKSTAMHIRRGDYVDVGAAFDAEKYREITQMYLDYFGGDTTLFVFLDDIAWAKANSEAMLLHQFRECVFVEGNMNGRNYRDLQLMSSCKYMMIGQSAFGFLAVLLNTELISCVNLSNREV